jgi:hypothetical protein
MLPDIRAVIAATAAAIGLLTVASGVLATLRVAQENRAGSLHAELVQRGHAMMPEPQPIMLLETPGPTLLARMPEVEPLPPAATEEASAPIEPPAMEREQPPQGVAAIVESAPLAPAPAEPDPDNTLIAAASPATPESTPIAAREPAPEQPAASALLATAPQTMEAELEAPAPPPLIAMGGPSPDEIARAKAQRKAAERARAKKAAEEMRKKARAARVARERKLAADGQKQQASASSQQGGFAFNPASSFNSTPFGNSFGGAINRR